MNAGTRSTSKWRDHGFTMSRSVVISDGVGPRVVVADLWPELGLPGLAVDVQRDSECDSRGPDGTEFAEYGVVFEAVDTLVLYSGGAGEVDLGDYTLDVLVPSSFAIEDCLDGCSVHEWVGWD